MCSDLGMSSARWQVLGALQLAGRALSASQVARTMGLARQSVQRVVNEMAADGFVSFFENPEHRRAKLIAPTSKGTRAFQTIMRRQTEWSKETAMRAGVSDRRIRDATALLRKLQEASKEQR